jgi:ribosomal protein S20
LPPPGEPYGYPSTSGGGSGVPGTNFFGPPPEGQGPYQPQFGPPGSEPPHGSDGPVFGPPPDGQFQQNQQRQFSPPDGFRPGQPQFQGPNQPRQFQKQPFPNTQNRDFDRRPPNQNNSGQQDNFQQGEFHEDDFDFEADNEKREEERISRELPRILKDLNRIEKQVSRVKKAATTKSLNGLGLNLTNLISEMESALQEAKQAAAARDVDEARSAMQYFFQEANPDQIASILSGLKQLTSPAKSKKYQRTNPNEVAALRTAIQEIIAALNEGNVDEAFEAFDEGRRIANKLMRSQSAPRPRPSTGGTNQLPR